MMTEYAGQGIVTLHSTNSADNILTAVSLTTSLTVTPHRRAVTGALTAPGTKSLRSSEVCTHRSVQSVQFSLRRNTARFSDYFPHQHRPEVNCMVCFRDVGNSIGRAELMEKQVYALSFTIKGPDLFRKSQEV